MNLLAKSVLPGLDFPRRVHLHRPSGKVDGRAKANRVIFWVHEAPLTERHFIARNEIMPPPVDCFS